jgi:hypothetical protein
MEKRLRLPGDCVSRLHDHATPESRAFKVLDTEIKRDALSSAPLTICWIMCDSALVEELIDIAATYSSEDTQIVSDAYVSAFELYDRKRTIDR